MSVSDAINIFLNRVRLEGGLPFDVKVPTKQLQTAIDEAKRGEVTKFDSIEDMMSDLKS